MIPALPPIELNLFYKYLDKSNNYFEYGPGEVHIKRVSEILITSLRLKAINNGSIYYLKMIPLNKK
jgi:hypothetical protein